MMRNVAGFTLIEAMVSIAIVSLVATAVLSQTAAASRAEGASAETITAASLAEHRMESLRLRLIQDLFPLPDSLREGRFEAPFSMYSWTVSIASVPLLPDLFDVEVTVAWGDGSFPLRTRWYVR